MFVQANNDNWFKTRPLLAEYKNPMAVCFFDESGTSFINRLYECLHMPVLVSLAIPFEVFTERDDQQAVKRKGFLVVNSAEGMMYGFGFLERIKSEFFPLLRKKEYAVFREKKMLCFLDYGSFYIEVNEDIWVEKRSMMDATGSPSFLNNFCKSPKRFLYHLQHRSYVQQRSTEGLSFNESMHLRQTANEHIYEVVREVLKGIDFHLQLTSIKEQNVSALQVSVSELKKRELFRLLSQQFFMRKSVDSKKECEYWIVEKMPVYCNEEVMALTKKQCDDLFIPYLKVFVLG